MDLSVFLLSITVLLVFGNPFITASEYDFDVSPVDKCPVNKDDWDTRSNMLNCSKTHGYHCVPNKHLSSLIEFCYPGGASLPFEQGNCLELAARGILNQVPCNSTFSSGCPDDFFSSRDLYRYPKCLAINTKLKCFDADVECIFSRTLEGKTNKDIHEVTRDQTVDGEGNAVTVILVVVILVLFIGCLIGIMVYKRKTGKLCQNKRGQEDLEEGEHLQPITATSTPPETRSIITNPAHPDDLEESDQLQPMTETSTPPETGSIITNPAHPAEEGEHLQPMTETSTPPQTRSVITNPVHSNGQTFSLTPSLDELESEHAPGDMELLLLLRRHCVDGVFENFIYLFKRKILKNDKKLLRIVESRDNNGCSLLHYAAKGGSQEILKCLLKHCLESKIDDTDNFGHTVLHFACKNGQYDLCSYILSDDNYCKRLLTKASHNGWNAAHFTAVSGNVKLFQLIQGKGEINIQSETKNGLNVLDIACIHNKTCFCLELLDMNNELKLQLGKTDLRGWNIAHFAAKVGNKDIFNYFINEEFASQKTFHGKTVLHICCEYGHYELCEFILNDTPFISRILHDRDDEGWNVFHYAAKGGNLRVFKMIEEVLKSSDPLEVLCEKTSYDETVLHICCIHKNVDICRYICNKLKSAPEIVNKPSTNRWTAAHYVAVEIKQDGSEEELIDILVEAGMDLKSQSNLGKTVLTVAFEHRNDNLIRYLLDNHKDLVNISTGKLREAAAHSKIYEGMLQRALQEVNSQQ